MKTVSVLALWALTASCHIDKLLKGGGTPPSDAPPARVAFSSSVRSARAGELITPPVQVTVQDSAGRVTVRDTMVTLSLAANPSGDSLRGKKQVRSVNGVATFADLRLDKADSGYTLSAAAPKLEADTSAAFIVMPAPATVLAFTVQPSDTTQGSPIKPPVEVTAYDALGNTATNFTGPIRMAFGTDGSVSQNAAFVGRNPVPAIAGVATFTDLGIDRPGVGYRLAAAFGSATPVATSAAFNITPAPPPTGDLTVTAATTGQDLDADGYTVTVDGGQSRSLGINASTTYSGLTALSHTVELTGIAGNCTVSGQNPRTVTVATSGTTTTFTITCAAPPTGSLRVTTSTSGESPDVDGYTVTVDGSDSQPIGSNSSSGVTFSGLSVSSHSVELTGVAANCTVTAPNPRDVAVTAGGTATTAFVVTCTALPGTLTVSTSTSGPSQDADGYAFAVDGGTAQAIGINQSITLTGVAAGSHTVVLSGVAGNCSVTGGTSRTVTLAAGGTATASFAITCTALPGTLTVSTSTSGPSQDPDGYAFAVDGGTAQAIGINQSITLTGVAAGSHTVVLSGVAGNCSVANGTSRTVTLAAGGTATASFAVSCTASTGSLDVTTSTSGGSPDPNGYTFSVDGGASQAIGTDATVTLTGLTAGSHTVILSGLASNCTVSGGTSRTVNVPAGGTGTASFSVSCTALPGSLTVTTSTSGASQDPDGYAFAVDGGTPQAIGINQSITLTGVAAGSHTVVLSGIAGNCSVSGGTSQTVNVPAGGTGISVSCTALPGSLTVTTSTSGASQDPDGYAFAVDGGTPQAIGVNQTITLTGVAAGSHTVVLSGVSGNCSVGNGTSRTVTVPAGGTGTASFSVSCTALPGSLTVTTSTSGASQDPDGYAFAVDGGTPQAIGINQTITLTGVAAGSHTVVLSGVAGNCSVSGGTSRTVNVPAGGTGTASFSVSCTALPGSLTVTTSTTGVSLDLDGYTVTVDGTTSQTVSNNGSVTFNGLSAGSHTVVLSGVAANCSVNGGPSQTVTVPAGGTTTAPFSITCTALPGSLSVSTTTSGGTPDPDGYTVTVNGGGSQPIGNNGNVTFSNLTAGSHTVTLSGLASNCTASGGTSRTVTVPAGGSTSASFSVSCPTPVNQPPVVNAGPDDHALTGLLYSFSWSFSDGNHNGPWSYTIDWGDGQTSSGNASTESTRSAGHTYVILLPRSFTITVTVTDASGASGSDSKVVSVTLL